MNSTTFACNLAILWNDKQRCNQIPNIDPLKGLQARVYGSKRGSFNQFYLKGR